MLAQSPTTTVFRLVKTKMTALSVLCDLCDGSGGVMRRPSAQTRVREITCPLNSCIIDGCEGTLIDKDRMIPAVLYTMSGPVKSHIGRNSARREIVELGMPTTFVGKTARR